MAETVVSFVVEKLCNLLLEEATFLHGVRDQVEWVEREMRQMQAFLQDADAKQTVDKSVANWVREVRNVAYDAEDAVDTYILQMHQQQSQGLIGLIKRYACILRGLIICHKTGIQIEGIKSRLQTITESRATYGIDANAAQETSMVESIVKERRESATQRDMNVFVGFDDDIQQIVKLLLDGEDRRRVISIVGMGGAGKTTLARRICNNDDVKTAFGSRRVLVSVSQTWNVNKILQDIAKVLLSKEAVQQMDEGELKDELNKSLEVSNYLIILDDVWETEVWGLIQPYLPDANNGSRVIITTRIMNVAKLADPSIPPYELRLLRDDESWNLFTKIVFPHQDASKVCNGELEKLGKKVVKGCGGLPLAVVVVAGFVSMKPRTPTAWQEVLQGINWENIPYGEACMQILALSYRHLPYYLKPCFLYLSCFPEDHDINARKLIHLWVAEGLVSAEERKKQRNRSRTLEDVAEDWLEELIQRCLLQESARDYKGRVGACQIHDLLLDLCRKKAKEANFFNVCQNTECSSPPDMTRRLALHPHGEKGYMSQEYFTPKLRTFLTFFNSDVHPEESMACLQFLKRLQLLRVIDLEYANCHELPVAIGSLIHLRYLGLCHNELQSIPSTVGKLQNLQTLDTRQNYHLKQLPDSVWGISNLRHMFIDDGREPQAIVGKELVNLQTLEKAKAGSWIQKSLATMKNLRRLVISCILPAHHPALGKALDNLLHLHSLELNGGDNGCGPLPRKALALPNHHRLEELTLSGPLGDPDESGPPIYASDELPPNLCELVLYYSKLQQDPLSLFGKLSYLKFLIVDIDSYVGEEVMCSADSFPRLQWLQLSALGIRRWSVEKGALPCLRNLTLQECSQLEMLPDGLQHVRTLQSLDTWMMSDEFIGRLRRSEGGQDWYKVQHIPSVYIDNL